MNGDYKDLFHTDSILGLSYLDSDVFPARLYRYRYRARNINGFGQYSEPGYFYGATVPNQPQQPTLMAVTRESI